MNFYLTNSKFESLKTKNNKIISSLTKIVIIIYFFEKKKEQNVIIPKIAFNVVTKF